MWTTTLLYWISAAFLYTLHGFPLSDDWAFTRGLDQLLRGTQVNFDHIGLANLFIAWVGLVALYRTMRRLGGGDSSARAGMLTLMCNPIFFVVAHLYTSDVAVLTLLLLAGHAYVSGAQEHSNRWTLAGSLLATAACFFRPVVGCMTLGVALWMMIQDLLAPAGTFSRERLMRYATVLVAPIIVGVSWLVWMHVPLSALAPDAEMVKNFPAHFFERLGGGTLYLGAFMIPWAFSHEPLVKGAWKPAVVILILLAALGILGLRPEVGGVIAPFGLGPCPWGDQCSALSVGLFQEPWFWKVALGLAALSALLLAWRLGTALDYMRSAWGGYAMGFALAFFVLLFTKDFDDRHYLLLFPPMIVFAAANLKFRWGDFAPLMLLIAAFSFFGTWNLLSWNHARTEAGEKLLAMKVRNADISNGEDWDQYYGTEKEGEGSRSKYSAFVTLLREPAPKGTRLVGQIAYWCPLNFRTQYMFLWKRWN